MNALAPRRLGRLPARKGGARAGWTALVAIVVLGILGMHAIGLHGSQHADPVGPAVPSAMPAMAEHDAIADPYDQGEGAVMRQGDVAALVSPLDLEHGMLGMAMLCVAVLVGAAMARRLIGSQQGSRAPLRDGVMTSRWVARRTLARQTGPPTAWAFSVIRC